MKRLILLALATGLLAGCGDEVKDSYNQSGGNTTNTDNSTNDSGNTTNTTNTDNSSTNSNNADNSSTNPATAEPVL